MNLCAVRTVHRGHYVSFFFVDRGPVCQRARARSDVAFGGAMDRADVIPQTDGKLLPGGYRPDGSTLASLGMASIA